MRVGTHASSTLALLVLQIDNAQLEAKQFHALLFQFVDRHLSAYKDVKERPSSYCFPCYTCRIASRILPIFDL